ncbi:MAG: GspH/FimT family pseudopilin [Candidatus Scalinduaceae bacterium]
MYNQKGFTLIEFIVVVSIIVVIAGTIIPVYFSMKPTIRVNGAARQLMGDLMWARMRAVSENNDYVIAFGEAGPDLSNDTYYIYDDDNGDFITLGTATTGKLVKTTIIPDRYDDIGYGYVAGINKTDNLTPLLGNPVTFASGGGTKPIWFRFRPNGISNIPGAIYLISNEDLANNKTERMRAITISIAGRVKIWNYNSGTSAWE